MLSLSFLWEIDPGLGLCVVDRQVISLVYVECCNWGIMTIVRTYKLTFHRFSRDRPRFTDTLDVIKFLCKDLWMLVFRKQIDNLKTNHRVRPS